ncbi:Oidioi.mRNA.OKI2018_I69.chr1.g2996.t2.cds [Oikopleura dioica]|nr:Oidioi.mRNA.OKI2018_I69.chr1.g2996.t2.cds [Oikopleura dioica]
MRAALKCTEQASENKPKDKSKKDKKKKNKGRREAEELDLLEFLDDLEAENETVPEPPCLPPAKLVNFNETERCNAQPCSRWALWSPYTPCSATCGDATKSRQRFCRHGEIGEADNCPSEGAKEIIACDLDECPYLGEWENWSDCSRTCGSGARIRKKPCINGNIGEIGCDSAEATEQISCATHYCPIYWGEWSDYSECSNSCGKGVRVKTRACQNELEDVTCPGAGNITEECFDGYCSGGSFSPEWASWGEWGECSTTCGPGLQSRLRNCTGDAVGSVSCPYDDEQQTGKCEVHGCPQWSLWNSWQPCDLDCEDPEVSSRFLIGSRIRRRGCVECPMDTFVCIKPSNATVCADFWAENNATSIETEECRCENIQEGSSEGSGSGDEEYEISMEIDTTTRPSVTTQSLASYLSNIQSFFSSEDESQRIRSLAPSWGTWMEWTKCSKTCDLGERTRYRPCSNGNIGDTDCPLAESFEQESCQLNVCRGEWLSWGNWGRCSASCDDGVRSRTRMCKDKNKFGLPGCQKRAAIEMEKCSDRPCSYWNNWTEWSRCSSSCGSGVSTRMRNCDATENIQENCIGNSLESKTCFIPEEDCLADIEEPHYVYKHHHQSNYFHNNYFDNTVKNSNNDFNFNFVVNYSGNMDMG